MPREAPSLRLDLPAAVRLLNGLLDPYASSFPDLSFGAASRAAETVARASDWGTPTQRARFERLCELGERHPNLTPWGRVAMRIFLLWKMVNHLRRVAFVARHPDVRDVEIEPPIFILGWYRTGTTLLHNVLGADPENRLPRTWELSYPLAIVDDPSVDRMFRRALTTALLSATRYVVPEQAAAHYIPTDGPEECFFLFENAGLSTTHINTFEAHDYAFELLKQDLREVYEDHALQLKLLSLGTDRRRFVMKCPFHLWTLDGLLEVYPEARIVQTHRSASSSLASNCSLSAMTTSKFVREFDFARHGRFWFDFYRAGMERGLAARDRLPRGRVADVRMSDLARDPGGTLRATYAALDMPCDAELAERFAHAARAMPKDQHGSHRYSLEDFGLDGDEVASTFAAYHDRFGLVGGRAESGTRSAPSSSRR